MTPILGRAYATDREAVNVRFHSYPRTDFAVGGRSLSTRIPMIARLAKRLLG